MGASASIFKKLWNKGWNNKGIALNLGMGGYFAMDTYDEERQNGASKAGAFFSAAADFALPFMMPLKGYMALEAGKGLIESAPELYMDAQSYRRELGRQKRGYTKAFSNSEFNDTEQYYTMRQAGMAIAQRSRYNVQQAMLGNEAKYMMK